MHIKNKSNRLNKFKIYIPIILIQIYLIGIMVLYLFGPLKWETHNKFNFYILIFVYQLALLLGYYSGIKVKNTSKLKKIDTNKLNKYLTVALILNIIITLLMSVRLSGMASLSIKEIFDKFIIGLTNPEYQYSQKFSNVTYGGSVLTYISVILAPITWTAIPIGVYYFRKINKKIDVLVCISVITQIMHWVIIGTNKGLFDLIIIIITVLMLKKIKSDKKKNKNLKVKLFFVILTLFVLEYFSQNISGRIGGNFNLLSNLGNGVEINTTVGAIKFLPENIQNLLVMLSFYLTQGYYAMSMAISLPFTSTLGIGNSIFLMENLKEITGIDLSNQTYQFKLEQFGWDSQVNWHSFYVWIANDVHFIGVVFVMFIIGYIYANLIKEFMLNENELSLCLLVLFMIMFFYIPANNQISASPNTCITFIVLITVWILKKVNKKIMK